FFYSSRRRHTRCSRDWSSDVCSSDLPLPAFAELISGCEADVRGQQYDTFAELVGYCRCVAGSIGRLSLGVFAPEDSKTAEPHAEDRKSGVQGQGVKHAVRPSKKRRRR